MTTTLEAIYEQGKLLLSKALPLPEKSRVKVTVESPVTDSDASRPPIIVVTGKDGLPSIRVKNGVITSQQVKEIESLTS